MTRVVALAGSLSETSTMDRADVPHARRRFDADGEPGDDAVARRRMEVGERVARFAALHPSPGARAFPDARQNAVENPGAG